MIGKYIDVTKFNKKQAIDFIKNYCMDCDIQLYCNGNDSKQCNDKKDYLVNKFKKKDWKSKHFRDKYTNKGDDK